MQSLGAVGNDNEVNIKDGSNGAVQGINVQGSGAVGNIIWQQELGGYRVDAQGPDSVPSSGGTTDHGDDGKV